MMRYKRITITLNEETLEELRRQALEEERPISRQISFVVNFYKRHKEGRRNG